MQKYSLRSWFTPAIMIAAALIFLLDLQTKLGIVTYIFYFIPVVLTVLNHSSRLPILVALMTTIFSILGYRYSPFGMDQEIAGINRTFSALSLWAVAYLVRRIIIAKNDSDEKDWVKSGLTSLSIRIRGEKNTDDLGREMLAFIAEYIDFKVGSLYYKYEDQKSLAFLAGYAYSETDKTNIDFGEGVLGQAALDKKIIEIHPLPENYIKVSSSLGSESPAYLIAIPLKADEEVIAVMELAFLKKPENKVMEFIKSMSELSGTALRSAQYKVKLAHLLQQSQQLAEELQAQQEELRVTNEELEQQSRALKESATRLEGQQAELEQSNQQLEEQAQVLESQKSLMEERNIELIRAQAALEEKASELAVSGRYKSEFLANMSHELRTPLNSSLILAKLLSENRGGNLNEEQIKYASIIYQSGNDLLNLINDILDLAKVESGKLVIQPEVIHIEAMLGSLEQTFSPQAQNKGLTFEMLIREDAPKSIITDRQRLEQILKNFLSNAMKFTHEGFIKLEAFNNAGRISFAVTDSGIGIPKEQQETIFEAFRQADGTTNRKYGGTGLGLSISKELALLLGGEIRVESASGKGSVFILDLPLEFSPKESSLPKMEIKSKEAAADPVMARPETTNEPLKGATFNFSDDRSKITSYKRVMLIIEDDENFAKVLYDLAHEMDFGALVAGAADDGLKLARTYLPQAIVLDIRLPDHNGLVVLDQLKMDPKTRHIPVHVMSSSDFSRPALEMGAMGYMMKPVKENELKKAFNHLSEVMKQKLKHVLVIEDNDIQRQHMIELIEDPSIRVDAVPTATEALDRLSSQTYDCMVMDLSLPDMSGHELLAKISSENSSYSFPPVIVYTARDLTPEEEEKLRLYAGSIIIKGAKSPERLLSEVTLFLHRVETDLPPERQKMLQDFRSREKSLEGRKILVTDDDVRNIFALTSALENYGAVLEVARNGREAIEKLEQIDDIELVLMDIMMPEMDGYEAITWIRKQRKFQDLSIIALTAKAMQADKDKCLMVGANDYLAKPIDMDKLLSLIKVWLPSKRSFGI